MAMKEHLDNKFLQRRKELDLKGCMQANSLREYDASVIVPMWGYGELEVPSLLYGRHLHEIFELEP